VTLASNATLVLCAGIPRSGSTWLYNAARLLLTLTLPPPAGESVYGAWVERYDASNTAPVHVVKVHEPDESLAWRARVALTSRRDLRDIAASAWKRGWVGDDASTLAFLDSVVRQHAFWQPRCAFEMVYERMRRDPAAELRLVAAALGLTPGEDALQAVAQDVEALGHDDASDQPFDASNLLHKRHIMDGRVGYHAQTLPADLLKSIQSRHAGWLAAHGYR
jgi:hypothetical protein